MRGLSDFLETMLLVFKLCPKISRDIEKSINISKNIKKRNAWKNRFLQG